MREWGDEIIRHKYDPLPDEPRYRKKAKKRRVRSDHKHEYEEVCVDAHDSVITSKGRFRSYHIACRCKICGRLYDMHDFTLNSEVREPPKDMRMFEVDDIFKLWDMRYLPDDLEVVR